MKIRLATSADYKRIATALRNKGIDYITPAHARTDIDKAQLYVLTEGDVLIAQCALVYEPAHQYHAIKRLVVYNRRHCGRGVAQQFLTFFCAMNLPALGCTPWVDNLRMQHLLQKMGLNINTPFCTTTSFIRKLREPRSCARTSEIMWAQERQNRTATFLTFPKIFVIIFVENERRCSHCSRQSMRAG